LTLIGADDTGTDTQTLAFDDATATTTQTLLTLDGSQSLKLITSGSLTVSNTDSTTLTLIGTSKFVDGTSPANAVFNGGSVGIGVADPETSASLEVSSTTKGLLPPRLTQAQMNVVASPVEGLTVYCSDCTVKGLYVFTGSAWEQLAGQAVAAQETASSSGETWMTMNLGAQRVATSPTDGAAYGDLYQWGRTTDGHEKRNSTAVAGPVASGSEGANFITSGTGDWLSTRDDTRWGATKTANDPCPTGYRVPTLAELDAERLLFATNDAAGAFGSILKLPLAGNRNGSSGAIGAVGAAGYYWASTSINSYARFILIGSSEVKIDYNARATGFSVRCIKE